MTIAEQLFESEEDDPPAKVQMISLLRDAGAQFEKIGWDGYDGSIELYCVPVHWRMPPVLQRLLWDNGFTKAYVNHVDFWETHYSFGTPDGFKAQPGWRVSYPHKRPENTGQIWVESAIPTWPAAWFKKPWWKWWAKPYVTIKSGSGDT